MSTSISPSSRSWATVGAVGLVQLLRREPGTRLAVARDVEIRAHLGARRTRAHHIGVGTPADGERQRIDEDRLARARLAGQRREAVGELEVEPLDDHVVTNGESTEHWNLPDA
jgi:hypothetical protein